MKKILLSMSVIATMTASAQGLNAGADGFTIDFTDGATTCLANSAPNNGGNMNADGATFVKNSYLQTGGLTLVSADSAGTMADANKVVTWFYFPAVAGTGPSAVCGSVYDASESMDVSAAGNAKVAIDVSSDVVGASFDFFLGGSGQWNPSSSTYNSGAGAGIDANGVISAANTVETFVFDYETLDPVLWTAWTGKNTIQSYGFRSQTSDAVFTVTGLRVGADVGVSTNEVVVNALNVYPNPATDVLNVVFDATSASSVHLTDLTGKVVSVQTAKVGANTISFDVANVNAGVYFVNINNAAGNAAQKVIIK
jgi:hypothetical protein